MAIKTKKRRRKTTILKNMFKVSTDMTYKDLKRNCVVRGMPFDDVINGSFPSLQNWIWRNNHNDVKPELLDDFDDHIEKELKERGSDYLIHPQLRLGYIGERNEDGEVKKRKRVKGIKKKRKKREKTKDGIYKGTKKAYVFLSEEKGWTLKKTIRRTLSKFPDASEKSIKIWYKKAARLHAKGEKKNKKK